MFYFAVSNKVICYKRRERLARLCYTPGSAPCSAPRAFDPHRHALFAGNARDRVPGGTRNQRQAILDEKMKKFLSVRGRFAKIMRCKLS